MNIEQVREVLDSLNIETSVRLDLERGRPPQTLVFKEKSFCISMPHTIPAAEDPPFWFIYKLEPRHAGAWVATVTDEFELQDWLINEYRTS